jgi:site-specific recombinase XerD
MATLEVKPRCWKVERWPALDQAAWAAGLALGRSLDEEGYAAGLRPASIEKARKGYGRWLDFLDSRGWLEPEQQPLARISERRVLHYARALRAAGNADYTIIGRVAELAAAMRILTGRKAGWFRKPGGMSIYAVLPKAKRPKLPPDSQVLYHWGISLMDTADLASGDRTALVAYRDGLILALLAARGRRLTAMANLRLAHMIQAGQDACWIDLPPELVKTRKRDRFPVPDALMPYLRHYLAVVRSRLLRGACSEALWISINGQPLTSKGFQAMVFGRTERQFGTGFGPHLFRHAMSTTAALRLPQLRGLAAGLLGISAQVVEQHYRLTGEVTAGNRFDQLISEREKELLDK